jgi:hypothetical protein
LETAPTSNIGNALADNIRRIRRILSDAEAMIISSHHFASSKEQNRYCPQEIPYLFSTRNGIKFSQEPIRGLCITFQDMLVFTVWSSELWRNPMLENHQGCVSEEC